MSLDWADIANKLIVMALGASGAWIIGNIRKAQKDLDSAFCKIRQLEREVYEDDLEAK